MKTNPTPNYQSAAVLGHPEIIETAQESKRIAAYLEAKGIRTIHGSLNDDAIRKEVWAKKIDIVITLGGDGTVLRAGHLCAPVDVPILPINMGSLGFLIEVTPEAWPEAIDRLLAGDCWFEDRMMLQASLWRGKKKLYQLDVLNDAVIARGKDLRPVHLRVSLDGLEMTTYVADALVVSTPTGSTAYALAA